MAKATVCIVYGFSEGAAHGRALRQVLTASGFRVVKDPAKADILIAHSGGCFVVPEKHQATLVILVGIDHWPGKSFIVAITQKVWNDVVAHRGERKLTAWLRKTGWNLIYGGNIRRHLRMLRGKRRGSAWSINAARLVLVRNHEDTFCTPDTHTLPFKSKPITVELIGQHDDIWLHPEPYVDIIQAHHGV
jgi:hypothetical protein